MDYGPALDVSAIVRQLCPPSSVLRIVPDRVIAHPVWSVTKLRLSAETGVLVWMVCQVVPASLVANNVMFVVAHQWVAS